MEGNMSAIEIILIILGIITIIISCRLVDRPKGGKVQLPGNKLPVEMHYSEEELKQQVEQLEAKLSDLREEIIVRTDDDLSRLSNEKIMAVGEYSDQIIEKIKHNHEEVVFLYNMLNDKEKELKTAVREVDASKLKTQSLATDKHEFKEQQVKKVTGIQQVQSQKEKVTGTPVMKEKPVELPVTTDQGTNNNSQILSLYSHGKSVVEISKLLGLGQGEVKLVIDLFRGRK
jgi:hypothetical protein